jgi:hypothetical protein
MVPEFGSIKDDLGYTLTKLDLWESLAHLQPNAYHPQFPSVHEKP